MTDDALFDELERYFGGELHAQMGLRCALGPAIDYGTSLKRYLASPPEPDGIALSAARVVNRVEEALIAIGSEHRCVLAAAYAVRTSWTTMALKPLDDRHSPRELGSVPAVVCMLADAGWLATLVEEARMRGKAHAALRERAQAELARIRARAKAAVQNARRAYLDAAVDVRQRRREERTKRFRRGVVGDDESRATCPVV